jgi:hypothetical protein
MHRRRPSTERTCLTVVTDAQRSRRSPRLAWFWLAAALSVLKPGAALAQAKDPAAAEALFREGRALSDAGDIAGACAKFRESDRLDPAVGTTFNIADCEEQLGHLARAWTLFDEVAQRLPTTDKRRAVAQKRAAALEPRLPKLSVRLPADAPAGTRVERDGVELGSASQGTPLPIDPGEHVVVVSAPGRITRSFKVIVSEREIRALDVAPGVPVASTPAEPAAVPTSREAPLVSERKSPVLGYVLGGIGAAGLLTGAVAGALVLHEKGVVDDHCDADQRCDDEGLAATKSGKTWGVVTTVGLVTGVVGVGAGTYLIVSAGSGNGAAASVTWTGRF